jgi:hypothetical protein
MKKLTKIEQLDRTFPGLADQVRVWFNQGVTAAMVSDLLREQFGIPVTESAVGAFRARRWEREREFSRQRRMTVRALEEFLLDFAMKGAPASSTSANQATLTSFFLPDKDCRLQPIADSLIEMGGRLVKK